MRVWRGALTFAVLAISLELVVPWTFTLVVIVTHVHTPVFTTAIFHSAGVHS